MGLTGWLAARAVRATRVLVVECPGSWRLRVALERAVVARGWRLAASPATADVLLVAGEARGELVEVVDRVWDSIPGPRARADVPDEGAVAAAVEQVVRRLLDDDAHRADAEERSAGEAPGSPSFPDHEGTDHGDMGHEGMDHGDMDMAPDGIPLAGASDEDRDGLEMDELPLRLGPVLPSWPAGLVLDLTLHGDLVVAATGRLVGSGGGPAPEDLPAARACDALSSMLALVGWEDAATRARHARDAVLDGDDGRAVTALEDLRRRVDRSRLLRWSLTGAAPLTSERAADLGVPDALVGDCLDRLRALLGQADPRSGPEGRVPPTTHDARGTSPEVVATLVTGLDLGVARLLVASLGMTVQREVADA